MLKNNPVFAHFAAIAQDSALMVVTRVVGMLAGLLLMIMLARAMPASEFGALAIAFSLAMIGGRLTTLNIDAGALRFVTKPYVEGDYGLASAFLYYGRCLAVRAAVAIAAAMIAFRIVWGPEEVLSGPIGLPVIAGLATAPLFGWLRIHSTTLAATGRVVLAAMPMALLRPVIMLAAVVLVSAITRGLGLQLVLALYFVTAAVTCLIQRQLFRAPLGPLTTHRGEAEKEDRREWIRVGRDLLIPTLFLELSVDTIILLASLVLSTDALAVMAIVLRIQAIILFGVTSINMVVGPRIAKAHSEGDAKTVNQLLAAAAHLKLWPSVAVLTGLALGGQHVLALFGPAYGDARVPLLVVSLSPIVMAIFGPVVLLVTLLGLQREANRIFQIAICLLAALILAMGAAFSVIGVCVAVVTVWIFWHLALNRLIRQRSAYRPLQPDPRLSGRL